MSPTQENSFTREMGRIAESLRFERNQLLQKVQQLEAENAELKERSRWRDAEKELPSYHYPAERDKPTIEFLVITDPYVVELFSGQYNPKSKEYIMERGFPITGGPDVVYWRPFSMPEYRNCVAGTKRKYALDLSEALESEGGSGMSETLLSEAERCQLLQKVQQLEKYSKGRVCIECIYHVAWENENWDIVHWCKAHARQVAEDDFCSMGKPMQGFTGRVSE